MLVLDNTDMFVRPTDSLCFYPGIFPVIAGTGHHSCTYNVTTRVQRCRYVCPGGPGTGLKVKGARHDYLLSPGLLSVSSPWTAGSWSEPEIDLQFLTHSRERQIRERGLLCNGRKRYEAVQFRKLILCVMSDR